MSLDTVCCSVLQCVAVCCSVRLESLVSASDALVSTSEAEMMRYVSRYSVLQCVAVCCSVLQCVAACCSVRLESPHLMRRQVRVCVRRQHVHISSSHLAMYTDI